jgi:hypothetical protein
MLRFLTLEKVFHSYESLGSNCTCVQIVCKESVLGVCDSNHSIMTLDRGFSSFILKASRQSRFAKLQF